MRISTLQPGLLVSLNIRTTGNVKYNVTPIEDTTAEGTSKARWETERVIDDVAEHAAAGKARSKARQIISSICCKSSFALLCPEPKEDILKAAIADARAVAEAFNATAKLSRLSINVIVGRIAADDVEAVRAINAEVRSLLDDMANGVTKLDPGAIREAASAARDIGKMLNPAMQERLQVAIDAVRAQARDFVKAGETAAKIVDQSVLNRLSAVRSGFLDYDDAGKQVELPLLGRAMDLEPETNWPTALEGGPPAPKVPDFVLNPGDTLPDGSVVLKTIKARTATEVISRIDDILYIPPSGGPLQLVGIPTGRGTEYEGGPLAPRTLDMD